ncbi:MAG: alpha/beta hydrolase [Pseudolysinimonas sp.]
MRVSDPNPTPLIGLLVLVALALGGCSSVAANASTPTPTPTAARLQAVTNNGVRVIPDIEYGHAAGQKLLLDACLPPSPTSSTSDKPDPAPRASIVMIHGGSWTRGDKADPEYRDVCEWLAKAGYPTFAVDYRMDPQFVFPAALDDVRSAVNWLRDPIQLGRFNLDPARIAAFGGSAGGNLASLLGTTGTGPLTEGSRVSAVVDLSGPSDLTGPDAKPWFIAVQLAFVGCAAEADCPAAHAASPIFAASADDPPFFIANSTDELIPIAQSERLDAALRAAGVRTTFVRVKGGLHSVAMLGPRLRSRILAFYASTLGANSARPTPGAG